MPMPLWQRARSQSRLQAERSPLDCALPIVVDRSAPVRVHELLHSLLCAWAWHVHAHAVV
eukprot:6954617-Alexandrium_andersonii.AAC.1